MKGLINFLEDGGCWLKNQLGREQEKKWGDQLGVYCRKLRRYDDECSEDSGN